MEENQYYPLGLTMAGISSKAFGRLENKIKFNGYEENKTFDLNWLESFYRTYDPQLGRFWQIDPKPNASMSPYIAFENNPIGFSDLLGDSIVDPKRTVGYRVYVVNYTRDIGSSLSYRRFRLSQMLYPNHTILIQTDKLDGTTVEDIKKQLGSDGYIKTLALDYHREAYDKMKDSDKDDFFTGLANGYTSDKTNELLGMCWAGGRPVIDGKPNDDLTKNISQQLDKATVFGLQTEAWNPSFYLTGNFGVTNPAYLFNNNAISKREREKESVWTMSFYSQRTKGYSSTAFQMTLTFSLQGVITFSPYVSPYVQKKQDWKKILPIININD